MLNNQKTEDSMATYMKSYISSFTKSVIIIEDCHLFSPIPAVPLITPGHVNLAIQVKKRRGGGQVNCELSTLQLTTVGAGF